jgi:predicted TIM-barrel fold metal-dependent hydrolase
MKKVGIDRVLFGSDTGAHDQAWELGKYLSMPVPDKQLIPGLGENFLKILNRRKG